MLLSLLLCVAAVSAEPLRRHANTNDTKPVHDLVSRLGFPAGVKFSFTLSAAGTGGLQCTGALKECARIDRSSDGAVTIVGSSVPAITYGLGQYLRSACFASLTWVKTGGLDVRRCTNATGLLPPMPAGVPTVYTRSVKWTYYQNVVDSSYSFAWFSKARWQVEVDWMALVRCCCCCCSCCCSCCPC